MFFAYFSIGIVIFHCIVGACIYIRDYIPNVFLRHRDFQCYLFFVLHKYLIFMWLSLPSFFFITLVFYVMHRETTFSLYNKNIHFALVLVSFHFLHFIFFSFWIYLCVKSEYDSNLYCFLSGWSAISAKFDYSIFLPMRTHERTRANK